MKATAKRTAVLAGAVGVFVLTGFFTTVQAGSKEEASKKSAIAVWTAPEKATKLENPLLEDAKATKAGKATYDQMCFVCHGSKGKGDGMAAVSLNPKPADFSSERVHSQTDGELFWKMTEGHGAMASYKNMLKEKQRWQLVNYIRTFGEQVKTSESK